ncbi:MAG: hypothetical protein R3C01_17985 [Planctomycetaceae bacterium]
MTELLPPDAGTTAHEADPANLQETAAHAVHPAVIAFEELVASRTTWIETFLKPWCQQAPRLALLRAHQEWPDIAGKVDPDRTLWLWAWSRFSAMCVEGLSGLDESFAIRVTLQDGTQQTGYPDARASRFGYLTLVPLDPDEESPAPLSIDNIASIVRD